MNTFEIKKNSRSQSNGMNFVEIKFDTLNSIRYDIPIYCVRYYVRYMYVYM